MAETASHLSEQIAEICNAVKLVEVKAAGVANLVLRLRIASGAETFQTEWEELVQQLADFTLAADELFRSAHFDPGSNSRH